MILLLDNYDSFTYNLAHLFYSLEAELKIVRNRDLSVDDALALHPDAIVLSPGPGRPERAGIMPELIPAAAAAGIPMLGVCLGHQGIGAAFGAKVVHARRLMHGKISEITHDGRGLFEGIRSPFKAVRYHSLALEEASLPPELEISCRSEDGEIMGVRHRTLPIEGIQYHPESILTANGRGQLANFLRMVSAVRRKRGGAAC